MTTRLEQETVVRWDQEERRVHLYTAYEPEMRKWVRLGYAVEVERTRAGTPSGWRATAPLGAVRLRALGPDGEVKRRRMPERAFGRRILRDPDERSSAG